MLTPLQANNIKQTT